MRRGENGEYVRKPLVFGKIANIWTKSGDFERFPGPANHRPRPCVTGGLYDCSTLHPMQGAALPENVEVKAESTHMEGLGSELFWRLLATMILASVLWILWLLWQITPKSAVNPIVFQIQQNRQSASGTIQRSPGNEPSPGASGADPGTPAPTALSTGTPLENLKMETQMKDPQKPVSAK